MIGLSKAKALKGFQIYAPLTGMIARQNHGNGAPLSNAPGEFAATIAFCFSSNASPGV
jgi:hypothetical protein